MASLSQIQWQMKVAASSFGLGTAAQEDSSDFADATQGGKADSALQPNSVSATVGVLGLNITTVNGQVTVLTA